MELMSTNAKGKNIKGKKLLLYGSCLDENPQYLGGFEDYTKLSFCPEKEHINMAFYKLIAMMSVAEELVVITTDGSPHCVQMHYIAEDVLKYSERKFPLRHFVVQNGKMVEVSAEDVKLSRYLSKIKKLRGST
ncbi:hypothetical protein [Candidatus Aciduliprofundum boonei]|uniref:4Fe-4S ferredoxin n=1 Tax=Aciduliprofundum boonei (strain DSM 19572 / T469) TaxID=439481 RepID=D3TAI3_ACIB4|nr:hypothetical protein [Candidatus Aciduliprofundum boonei]ADD09112.1 conserved hypothetical protein [Aciduliprofundum boonei T469]HII55364.1 hypothetical protein [Candidatus Aciduliprofundum boonei]